MDRVEANCHWSFETADCPLCQERRATFVGFRGGWAHRQGKGLTVPIVRCKECGLLYPQPRPTPRNLSHYAEAKDYFGASDTGEARIQAFTRVIGHATALLGRAGGLLDVGCGKGESLAAAQRLGWGAVGVEPTRAFAEEGRRTLNVDIRDGLLAEADLPPNAGFDFVILSGVLEHVGEPLALLEDGVAFLRPGGLVFVDVPNERSLLQRGARLGLRLTGRDWTLALSPTFPPYHVVGFSPPSLRYALRRAGLHVVSLATYPLSFEGAPRVLGRVANLVDRVAAGIDQASGLVAWARKA